jgi:hypothetical protein
MSNYPSQAESTEPGSRASGVAMTPRTLGFEIFSYLLFEF